MDPILTIVAGATVLTVITIMFGGTFLLRASTGHVALNGLQQRYFRAGHAHAGVLVILGLVCLLVQTAAAAPALWGWASVGVLASAILIPAGFFLSVLGNDPQRPGRALTLIWVGASVLTLALVAVGVSVILAGVGRLS